MHYLVQFLQVVCSFLQDEEKHDWERLTIENAGILKKERGEMYLDVMNEANIAGHVAR
jgi:hypothetical protein